MKTKRELKNFENELCQNAISLKKFLSIYCGISVDNLIDVKLAHKDIKKIFPRLTKLPGGAELNPETVEEQKENKNTYDELVAKKAEDKAKQEEQENKQ